MRQPSVLFEIDRYALRTGSVLVRSSSF